MTNLDERLRDHDLLEAAPDLLKAVKWAIRELCEAWDESEEKAIPDKYRTAIARAEGRVKT